MNLFLRYSISFIVIALWNVRSAAQKFSITYNFSSVTSGTSGRTDPSILPTVPGIVCDSFRAIAPIGNPNGLGGNSNAGGRFSFTGWPTGATSGSDVFSGTINTNQYYQLTISPKTNFTLSIDSITFTVQRSTTGMRQYAVRSSLDNYTSNLPASIDPQNPNLQVVSGNIFQIVDGASSTPPTLPNAGSKITLAGFNNLSAPVTFRFYGWNAEASGGTFSIDDVKFSGAANPIVGAPVLTMNTASLSFPSIAAGANTPAQSYTISGVNLTAPLIITATGAYVVSEDDITYNTKLNIPAVNVIAPKTIYVRFAPTTIGSFGGTITNTSVNANAKTINLTGEGIDPTNLSFNFNTCTNTGVPGSGFTRYSVAGSQQWTCTTYGYNFTNGVNMTGFLGSALTNENWLISPALQISALSLPVLSFYSRAEFSGPSLELLVSTDYSGTGNPNTATWTTLNANFPPVGGNVWTLSDNINLKPYKSFPYIYIAFKYISSPTLGAPRWTLDSLNVTNRTALLSVNSLQLNFGETYSGANSIGQAVTLQAIGHGDITINAPFGYQVSLDNSSYSNSIFISQAIAEVGCTFYVRFSPTIKELKMEGQLSISGTDLNQNLINLSGSSYPKSETFDAACYNLSFFGSNDSNTPTQAKIDLQVANIATVINRLKMDVIGVEEVSNDVALDSLIKKIPGYAAVISNRWSVSYRPPEPNFPPQKIGFIYDTTTMKLVDARPMFEKLYDSARTGLSHVLDNYPGSPSSFWASGRLPFMATFNTKVNGITKQIRMVVIHAKSISDQPNFLKRKYDAKVLKDTLEAYYPNDNIIIVGDYNDRVVTSTYTGSTISPYQYFLNNTSDSVLTYSLDSAGINSFQGDVGMIDHIIASKKLLPYYISNSTGIEPANTYITSYGANTASDHLPVYARFNFANTTLLQFNGKPINNQIRINWSTATEQNINYFIVERSADGRSFNAIAQMNASGNNNTLKNYEVIDPMPIAGINYYRLKMVDMEGHFTTSQIILLGLATTQISTLIYPNPVTNYIHINSVSNASDLTATIMTIDGRIMLKTKGNIAYINTEINKIIGCLQPNLYILKIYNAMEKHSLKFLKQ